MTKYHIGRDGLPKVCHAQGACPLGGSDVHVEASNLKEAQAKVDQKMAEKMVREEKPLTSSEKYEQIMKNLESGVKPDFVEEYRGPGAGTVGFNAESRYHALTEDVSKFDFTQEKPEKLAPVIKEIAGDMDADETPYNVYRLHDKNSRADYYIIQTFKGEGNKATAQVNYVVSGDGKLQGRELTTDLADHSEEDDYDKKGLMAFDRRAANDAAEGLARAHDEYLRNGTKQKKLVKQTRKKKQPAPEKPAPKKMPAMKTAKDIQAHLDKDVQLANIGIYPDFGRDYNADYLTRHANLAMPWGTESHGRELEEGTAPKELVAKLKDDEHVYRGIEMTVEKDGHKDKATAIFTYTGNHERPESGDYYILDADNKVVDKGLAMWPQADHEVMTEVGHFLAKRTEGHDW